MVITIIIHSYVIVLLSVIMLLRMLSHHGMIVVKLILYGATRTAGAMLHLHGMTVPALLVKALVSPVMIAVHLHVILLLLLTIVTILMVVHVVLSHGTIVELPPHVHRVHPPSTMGGVHESTLALALILASPHVGVVSYYHIHGRLLLLALHDDTIRML